jgi:hypothetical protein
VVHHPERQRVIAVHRRRRTGWHLYGRRRHVGGNGAPALASPIGAAAGLSAPASINVDTAGSLWIANAGNNTVTEIIGVAAPVVTPVSTAVTYSTLATKP